jgi:plasmid stabilization system protein ParE
VNPAAAARAVRVIVSPLERIPAQPRLGERLPRFESGEVRRVLVGDYEVRYELIDADIVVLRLIHSPEGH